MKMVYSAPSCKVLLLQTVGVLAVSASTPSKYDKMKEENADQLANKSFWANEESGCNMW